MTDLETSATDRLMKTLAERREYALRGAWRADYDYVHVYRVDEQAPLAYRNLGEFTVMPDILEPTTAQDPPEMPGLYLYTYDLTSVPDDAIRAAIRGDIDPEEFES